MCYISEQTWRLSFKDVILSWFSIMQQKSIQLLIRAVSTDKVHIPALVLVVSCLCALVSLLLLLIAGLSSLCVASCVSVFFALYCLIAYVLYYC